MSCNKMKAKYRRVARVLKNFARFTGKKLHQMLFLNKVAGMRPIDSDAGVFL